MKTTGAPPPRKVIVQQCIRDKGVLEAICDYVSTFFGYVFFFFYNIGTLFEEEPFELTYEQISCLSNLGAFTPDGLLWM